jgi:RNA polymerase sigma-70 factor (ECF subfamily)
VLVLHVVQECSYDEISRMLAVPPATVGTRILRARRKMRAYLEPLARA